jgi:UDPglucose 6-dehydrogenase
MRIAIIGTGYVGLVTGTCLADNGNEVVCVDSNQSKIEMLLQGRVPIYEPGLAELVARNAAAGRLRFTTSLADAVAEAQLIFIAVGTPPAADGSADLSFVWQVVDGLAPHLAADAIVVLKSTVPVGTNAAAYARLKELTGRDCDVASNPEFLKEGAAINDFMYPDRVVVGVRRPAVAETLRTLYSPLLRTGRPFLAMAPESAELTKYVANAMLATKISFINEMANICERVGADINEVRHGIGHDHRIGFAFLFPGVGYGGSCFPKDVRALAQKALQVGVTPRILDAVEEVNDRQKHVLLEKIRGEFPEGVHGLTFAIWGLSFKPRTDDIREAPSLTLIAELLAAGARLQVHDPEAIERVREQFGSQLVYAATPLDALEGADALAINTEWGEFRSVDLHEIRRRMKRPVMFDGRNLYEPALARDAGFVYHSIGRVTARSP